MREPDTHRDSFDEVKERILRARQKGRTDSDKWKEIYGLLFPDEPIPSPCMGNPPILPQS